jgi:hypothetical protein
MFSRREKLQKDLGNDGIEWGHAQCMNTMLAHTRDLSSTGCCSRRRVSAVGYEMTGYQF